MSLLNYVPYVPSCLTRLRAFAPYAPLCLRELRALIFTSLNYAPCASYLLFGRLTHLGYIFIPSSFSFFRIDYSNGYVSIIVIFIIIIIIISSFQFGLKIVQSEKAPWQINKLTKCTIKEIIIKKSIKVIKYEQITAKSN